MRPNSVRAEQQSVAQSTCCALSVGHDAVAKILVENGANTTLKNKAGKDALTVAKEYNKPNVCTLLVAAVLIPALQVVDIIKAAPRSKL